MPTNQRVNPELLQHNNTLQRYEFVLKNHETLISFLKDLPPNKHDQGDWGTCDTQAADHYCGTSACAMGWAAASGEIPGLGHCLAKSEEWRDRFKSVRPTVNGERSDWGRAAVKFFGESTLHGVFLRTDTDLPATIDRLERRAEAIKKTVDKLKNPPSPPPSPIY